MIGSRRGVLLPIVLLLILGLAALSTSALILARTELVADSSGRRHVRDRALAERVLRSPAPVVDGFDRLETDLLAGFRLVEARPAVVGLSYFAVEWVLDPDSVVAGLPGGLEAGGILPAGGVEPREGCAVDASALLARRPASLGPDGALRDAPPRLGLLGVTELLALPGMDLTPSAPLPALSAMQVLRARGASFEVRGGDARGLTVSEGDLILDGSTHLSGILVVGGDLILHDAALFEGVAVVGGEARIYGAARLLGCPDLALDVLRIPELARGHLLPAGSFLGRQ